MKLCVLVVDVIHDFVYGKFGSARAQKILKPLKALLADAREKDIPVIYVTDAHLPDVDREFEIWQEHAVEGSKGAEVVTEVAPMEGDHRVLKRRYSCFYATGLDALLRELGVETLVLAGLVTNICIQHTAADAFFRGYRIVVPRDCVEAATDEAQEESLKYMEEIYGADITESEGLLGRLLRED